MSGGEGTINGFIVAAALVAGLAFFVGLWTLITKIISMMGWAKFTARHAATGERPPTAERLSGQTLEFGTGVKPARYRGAINAWIDAGGVYLRPLAIFRMFHPMLYLRWPEIEVIETTSGIFNQVRVRIRVSNDLPVIGAYGRLGEAMARNGRQRSPAGPQGRDNQ